MTEWWQQGEDDVPAPVPRRDQVPETGFSDPREVVSSPELVTFIPEWRGRRRVIASIATAIGLVVIASSIHDIYTLNSITCPVARQQALGQFILDIVWIAVVFAVIVLFWHWAEKRDPRDLRKANR